VQFSVGPYNTQSCGLKWEKSGDAMICCSVVLKRKMTEKRGRGISTEGEVNANLNLVIAKSIISPRFCRHV